MSKRSGNRRDSDEAHGIRLPGQLLDQINSQQYNDDDERFQSLNSKKRSINGPNLSRKQRRKEERNSKKQKKLLKPSKKKVNRFEVTEQAEDFEEDFEEDVKEDLVEEEEEKNPLHALAKLKAKKAKKDILEQRALKESKKQKNPLDALKELKKGKKTESIRIVKEDDLNDEVSDLDDVSDFDVDHFEDDDEELNEDYNDLGEDSGSSEMDHLGGFSEGETEDPISQVKALKEKKKKEKLKGKTELTPNFLNGTDRDEDDMAYYAKKLGLKQGKQSRLEKEDDDDLLGGIFDGLDFNYLDDPDKGKEEQDEDDLSTKDVTKPFSSDDEISEGDFDSEDDDEDDEGVIPRKENPYIAPTEDQDHDSNDDDEPNTKYIPPALRRKLALEASDSSTTNIALQRAVKGPLNKLSEANISTIVNEINGLYLTNSRHEVNETLISTILDSIIQQGRLLDTFVYLHASLVTAIYRLQGVEFAAFFVQTLVEKFEKYLKEGKNGKEISNIASLLSSVYQFQLISSKLIYDVIKMLINGLNEVNAELLIRIVTNSGNQMRSDDPTSLKEIVLLMNDKTSSMKGEEINPRTRFLIDTIKMLKNNKLKVNNEASHQLAVRLKKFLATVNNNKFNDPIQVSLSDIQNVNTRGKWWLVGSAWKGHDDKQEEVNFNEEAMNDILDNTEPNWMELARQQRMNTDIRRAIFVSIMSANDYIDAMTKLDKLALKRSQERELPRVLIHCTSVEPAWNPYYGILAAKLCDSHSYRKTFQFILWDLMKEFEGVNDNSDAEDFLGFDGDGEDDESKLRRVLNLGRFFGFLLAEGSVPLHALKNVNFLTATSDVKLFLEVILVTFLDQIGKKSQINAVGMGVVKTKKTDIKFDDKILIERLIKAKDQHSLLKGLQYFLEAKVQNSSIITGKRQKKRIEWGINALHDFIDELLREVDHF